ncbi:hypothetical protein JCM8547_001830 [Rhodosporidiobolus lusitaniae]
MRANIAYLASAFLAFATTTLAAPIPSSSSSSLRIEYLDWSSSLAVSTPRYRCPLAPLGITGASFPVRIEALSDKGFEADFVQGMKEGKEPEVLAVMEADWAGEMYLWTVEGAKKGDGVILRVTDAEGKEAFAWKRTASDAHWVCHDTTGTIPMLNPGAKTSGRPCS